jgi:DNA-binding transcriptional ArsR family regulator
LKQYQNITDPALAKALAHPLRTRILAALENRTASPSEIAEELGAPLGVVSYHVRRLQALHFVKLVKRVPRRGAVEHYYTTVAGPHVTNSAWSATPTIVKEAAVSAALEGIGSYVNAAAVAGGFNRGDMHLSRTPLVVDEKGWKALARELDSLLVRIEKIEADSQKRLLKSDHVDEQKASVVLMLFNAPPAGAAVAASREDEPATHRRRRRAAAR